MFNTLRLGGGWDRRLREGVRVFLAHKHEVIGSAKVVYLRVGPKEEIVRDCAEYNHVERALRVKLGPDWSLDEAIERRLASMRKNYGLRAFENSRLATAIYLRPK